MSLFKLLIHSFSIIAVFKYHVLFRSILIVLLLEYFNFYLGNFLIFYQLLISLFCLIIFIVSFREKKEDLITSQENLKNIEEITH